jgi:drug/metabolite transporter (DMT)-like permease
MTAGGSAPPSQFLRSVFWAILTAISFAFMMTSVRYMDGEFDAFQIVLFRALIGILLVIPLVTKSGFGTLKTDKSADARGADAVRAVRHGDAVLRAC